MEQQKNIDRLFQEKLKDFEVTPDPKIWDNIEKKMKKKEKRRLLPIWFWGGVAACLILSFMFFPFNLSTSKNNGNAQPTIVEINTDSTLKKNTIENLNVPVIVKMEEKHTNPNSKIKTDTTPFKKSVNRANTSTFALGSSKYIAENTTKQTNENSTFRKLAIKQQKTDTTSKNDIENKTETKIATKKEEKATPNNTVFSIKKEKTLVSLNDEKEKNKNSSKTAKNWFIQASVGVLNSNSFTNASTISNDFNNYASKGENNMSYGVVLGVALNKKWSVQSGIHLQEISYNSNNIVVDNIQVFKSVINQEEDLPEKNHTPTGLNLENFRTDISNLNQSFKYVEVPFEIKYRAINISNFSTDVVLGGSSLILYENKASYSEGNSENKAFTENINPVNFTGNIGLDFSYKINEKISFHVNPMFKKPFNTFSDKSLEFNPYQLGIYSGINLKF